MMTLIVLGLLEVARNHVVVTLTDVYPTPYTVHRGFAQEGRDAGAAAAG